MKYFRSYPYPLQGLLLVLLFSTILYSAHVIIPALFTKLTGFSVSQLISISPASSPELINAGIIVNGLGNLFTFCLSAFLFAYLSHPRPAEYLGLESPVLRIQPVLVIFIMIGAMPLLMGLENLVSKINFNPDVKKMQEDNENTMSAFLNITSFGGMLKVLFFLAVIPAIGEEMFFRGILLRVIRKYTLSMSTPIFMTAIFFALFHADIYGMPSIFLAGILLAVIYYLTGSLWCSILAHVFFNGTQIILSYAYNRDAAVKTSMDSNTTPAIYMIAGAVVFGISFYLLLKNKTPLPQAWANDFGPKEPKDDDIDITTTS